MARQLTLGLATCLALNAAWADSDSKESGFSISGFGSLVGGKSYGNCQDVPRTMVRNPDACTLYIADWGYGGIYTPKFSTKPESVLGIQISKDFGADLSSTVQLTSRQIDGHELNLEWAYLTYRLTPNLSFQAGRQRLPLYYYSNSQDVGYVHGTIGLSPAVYGWDVTNYNGVNLTYKYSINDWALQAEVLGGSERGKESPYVSLFQEAKQDIAWKNILGGTLEFSHSFLSGRLSYIRSNYTQTDHLTGESTIQYGDLSPSQEFIGVALHADFDNWILRSEVGTANRMGVGYRSRVSAFTAAYRFGNLTPTLGYASYNEKLRDPGATPSHFRYYTMALRYDFARNMDFKIQFIRFVDVASPPFEGTANLINMGVDFVF